jgi:hypothetical protein
MTWQNNPQQPQNPYGPQQPYPPMQPQPPRPPRRPGSKMKGLLGGLGVLALLIGLGVASSLLQDSDDSSSSSSSSSGSEESQSWKLGDCGGPDAEKGGDSYRTFDCGDPGATIKALKLMKGSIMPDSIQCPAGTDVIIEVKMTYGVSDSGGGIPSQTVCGRNLKGDHPGDAGAGGGQLVKGDCIDNEAQEIPCSGAGASDYKVLGLVEDTAQCPAGTTEPMKLMIAIGRPYSVICGGKV